MRVQANAEDVGRCGCGRREYCDGSHGLTELEWLERCARESVIPSAAAGAVEDEQGCDCPS